MKNNNQAPALTPRKIAEQKYSSARSNLLVMILFTALNIFLMIVNSDLMFLFSATIPYIVMFVGYEIATTSGLIVCGTITAIIMLIYLLCWILSKKKSGWIVCAMVFFAIDTLVMGGLYVLAQDATGIVDVLFHAWVLYYLIVGVINGAKLKKLPEEEEETAAVTDADNAPAEGIENEEID